MFTIAHGFASCMSDIAVENSLCVILMSMSYINVLFHTDPYSSPPSLLLVQSDRVQTFW